MNQTFDGKSLLFNYENNLLYLMHIPQKTNKRDARLILEISEPLPVYCLSQSIRQQESGNDSLPRDEQSG
jgi:hypothetical protein